MTIADNAWGSSKRRHPNKVKSELVGLRRSLKSAEKKDRDTLHEWKCAHRTESGVAASVVNSLYDDYLKAHNSVRSLNKQIHELERELAKGWEPQSWGVDDAE